MIDESIADPDAPGDAGGRRELLDALAHAFRDNPMNVAIHGPDPARRVRANRAGLRALVLDTADRTVARLVRAEGRVVGGFVAVPPGAYPLSRQSIRRQLGSLIGQGARAMDRWSRVSDELGLCHPDWAHWYVSVFGVVPWCQGYGRGHRLILELRRIQASNPCPIYLESDRFASVRFYRAHGFEVLGELSIQGVRCWRLGWECAGAQTDLCDSVREP